MDFTRRMLLGFFLLLSVGLLFGQICLAGTHVFRPENHSVYLDQRDPNTNWVSKTGLLVVSTINENCRTVLRFDLG